ncbi:MAG: glycosyltransferase family 1 protein [Chloroflexi bacterium]|nr:glycosyltransferase family 1 protein [Chloroflexota bacterium]
MKILGRISVFPKVPDAITRLNELAYNLWWSWNSEGLELYCTLDPELWEEVNHNPVLFLSQVRQERLDAAASDNAYLALYERVLDNFDAYMHPRETWFSRHFPDMNSMLIAYFSAEFGLHESLPIYSGGLGILSGDHCKAASDLGLPFAGVGFLYPQGYFKQRIGSNGEQEAIYEKLNFAEVPARLATTPNGEPVVISVELPGRSVFAKVWHIQVGRIALYLMDTDVEPNAPEDRVLAARLYGGDQEMRISQEIVLGIGGIRALRTLGLQPTAWHMNEGHSAFLGLERIRELIQDKGLSFEEARQAVAAGGVFTTHTPVAAGNDVFPFELMGKYFWQYWGQLKLNREEFLGLAQQDQGWGPVFSMTVLALRLSSLHNGVSELHGKVARAMWQFLWPDTPADEIPITSITNGIHSETWLAPDMGRLYDAYLGPEWRPHLDDPAVWSGLAHIPDNLLWETRQILKQKLIDFVRDRIRQQRLRLGESPAEVDAVDTFLDPNALTIGFARRFATYKRATLIFRDQERLKRILNNPQRPVQIIFAGKAHPADEPGKALIQQVYHLSRQPGFLGKILFVENYDMTMARYLVQGVDLWLNTPRRPLEASGTSGQKGGLNGVPSFSVLDGWWREGYNGRNGWAIGQDREFKDQETQDEADSRSLYATLENDIVPSYFDRQEGIPVRWLKVMREAIGSIAPLFSTHRMLKEYTHRLYVPAAQRNQAFSTGDYTLARELAAWRRQVLLNWSQVSLEARGTNGSPSKQLMVGEEITIEAQAQLGNLSADAVIVEVLFGQDGGGYLLNAQAVPLVQIGQTADGRQVYKGNFKPAISGSLAYGVRLIPWRPELSDKHELGLVRWA